MKSLMNLQHITDPKPITARACIKVLPILAQAKPELAADILLTLQRADTAFYKESMRSLVNKDIQKAIADIQRL